MSLTAYHTAKHYAAVCILWFYSYFILRCNDHEMNSRNTVEIHFTKYSTRNECLHVFDWLIKSLDDIALRYSKCWTRFSLSSTPIQMTVGASFFHTVLLSFWTPPWNWKWKRDKRQKQRKKTKDDKKRMTWSSEAKATETCSETQLLRVVTTSVSHWEIPQCRDPQHLPVL